MDFRKLLDDLNAISEAGTKAGSFGMYADNPEIGDAGKESDAYKELTKNVPQAPVPNIETDVETVVTQKKPNLNQAPNIDNVTINPGPKEIETPAPAQQVQPAGNSENLIKQLYDISTKLQQLNQKSIESWKNESIGNIQHALLESFNLLFEGPESDQRDALIAQANTIIKSLGQFPQDERIADAIATAQRAMKAPASPGPMYPVDNNKVKRFQELMAKATAPKVAAPTGGKPAVPTSAGEAQKKDKKYDPQVEKLQKVLLAKGYDLGPRGVDGNLGSKTIAAMQAAKIGGISDADIAKIPQTGKTVPPNNATQPSTGNTALPTTKPVGNQPVPKPDAGGSSMATPPTTNIQQKLSLNSTPDKIEAAFNALPTDKKVKLQKFLQGQDESLGSQLLSKFGMGGMDLGQSGELDQQTKALLAKYKHDAVRYLQNPV